MKKLFALTLCLLMAILCLAGCKQEPAAQTTAVDYSRYPFTGVRWTREADHDIETISFGADGSFRYSCACGNPVGDADLCEGYRYDEATATITLDYIELTEESIGTITVVSCTEQELVLDFDGQQRIFVPEG